LLAGGDLGKAGNIAARLDTQLLGRYAYEWDAASGRAHEPEGLLSTLGALASTLLGLRAGELLRRSARRELAWLAAGCLLLGALSAAWLPWNKQLWTPSFVLWTGGWATAALLLAHQLVDRWSWRPLGRAFGVNAIAAYAGAWVNAVLLAGLGWMAPLYVHGFGWMLTLVGPRAASLAFALAFVALWALVVRWMDRRGLYLKV
jgi:predicted acyltransferase